MSRLINKSLLLGIISGIIVGFGGGLLASKYLIEYLPNNIVKEGKEDNSDKLTWSHPELINFLKNNGLAFTAENTTDGSLKGIPMYFLFEDGRRVFVRLQQTTQDAKDYAGNKGLEAFSWNRFYFTGPPDLLTKISKVLKANYNYNSELLPNESLASLTVPAGTEKEFEVPRGKKWKIIPSYKGNPSSIYYLNMGPAYVISLTPTIKSYGAELIKGELEIDEETVVEITTYGTQSLNLTVIVSN